MRRELLYAAPIAGMIAIPILRKRIAPGVEAVVYTAEKTVKPGDSCSFTVVFKNEGEISTTVTWQPSIGPESSSWRSIGSAESFTIGGGEQVSKSRTFTMPSDLAGHDIDLKIAYSFEKEGTTVSKEVTYYNMYGKYAWHVQGLPDVKVVSISIS